MEKDNRRETREVFHTQPTELAAGFRLHPGDQRSWNVRQAPLTCAPMPTTSYPWWFNSPCHDRSTRSVFSPVIVQASASKATAITKAVHICDSKLWTSRPHPRAGQHHLATQQRGAKRQLNMFLNERYPHKARSGSMMSVADHALTSTQ